MVTLSLERQLVGKAAGLLPFLEDEGITDLLINGPGRLFVERRGRLIEEPSPFPDRPALLDFIERLVVPIGKRIDASHPYIDGRMADGSRFHVILPPIAPDGPLISIRRKRTAPAAPLASFGSPSVIDWLSEQLRARRNILIGGGTGCGKTTLLCRLLDQVAPEERVAVIEESREIQSEHSHLVFLEGRAASPDGKGEVSLRCLVRNALRMRPDRIILGECRGAEAFEMLQAMNTGHPGSLGTIHANGALDALKRLESLALLADAGIPWKVVREWVAASVDVVVFLERKGDERKLSEILTVQGLEGDVYRITPVLRRA